MNYELALLNNCLIVGALLFGLGMIGFLSRRNVIVMFLSLEIMLQGVAVSLAAWGRYHDDFGGQAFILFIIAVAACEAAVALAVAVILFQRSSSLDIAGWQLLREANQPAFRDKPLPPLESPEPLPHLPPAGVAPEISPEELDFREHL